MRSDHGSSRTRAPRLIVTASALLGLMVLATFGTGGAAAVPGPTDLSLTKSDTPDPVVAGNNVTYTIRVTNPNPSGGSDATNVVVTDNLPSGVDFVSATGGSCQRAGNTVTCDLGTVLANTTATVTIVVKTKKQGTLSNTAAVTSPEDVVLTNNSATATTTVSKKPKKARASCATPSITGTAGDDVLVGTPKRDAIVSFSGNDQIFSGDGKDLVCAGSGFDLVVSGLGADTVIGGSNADRLVGQDGGDLLKGKRGRDRLRGQTGNDVLNGGRQRDSCKGGAGRDALIRCP
jgi:uncharacterized repeat protein (TIGR01451 family)